MRESEASSVVATVRLSMLDPRAVLRPNPPAERPFGAGCFPDLRAHMAMAVGEFPEGGQRAHVAVRGAPAIVDLLPLPHHAEVAIVERDDLDRRLVLQASRELLDAHLDRALAGDAEHVRVRLRELDAHRIWQAHAHRSQAAGIDPATRLLEAV